jgi:hypothetical protein
MTLYLKRLIDGIKSWDITCELWWFCASMTLECEMLYDGFCLNDPWMRNMTYDGFMSRWSLNVRYAINGLMPRWPLNVKYYIWWFCVSMPLEWEIWYMIVLYSMTLECKIWYMMALCLDDPQMWNMIYDGFVSRCLLNEKYNLWWLSIWPLIVKYVIWWFCVSMALECEILYMMVLCRDNPLVRKWYIMTVLCLEFFWMRNMMWWLYTRWPLNWYMMVLCTDDPWLQNMILSLYDTKFNIFNGFYI